MAKNITTYLCKKCRYWFALENFILELGVCVSCGAEENEENEKTED